MSACKVLVVGAQAGQPAATLSKVTAINTKSGPFDCCLLLGDVLSKQDESLDSVLDGSVVAPLPCYFTMGSEALPHKVLGKVESNHGEIAENLVFLGKQSIFTLASGHRLAAFGGAYDVEHFTSDEMANATQPLSTAYFTASSADTFKQKLSSQASKVEGKAAASTSAPIDILLSTEWPTEITHGASKEPAGYSADWGVPAIADILSHARPRYHFVSKRPCFWEREPFRWSQAKHATRFISLGQIGNKDKQRWFYAMTLPALDAPAAPIPANTTACPLEHASQPAEAPPRGTKRPFGLDDSDQAVDYIFGGAGGGAGKGSRERKPPPKSYICRLCQQPGHYIQDCEMAGTDSQPKKARMPQKEITPSECWFCLSNPKLSKHLLVSIGSECYVALPKGQLPNVKAGAAVPGGGMCLIVPIAHFPTLKALPAEQAVSVVSEIERIKSALRQCYAQFSCAFLSFEVARNSGKGGHAHIQVCPIPQDLAETAEDVFRQAGQEEGYSFEEGEASLRRARPEDSYFRVDLPDGKVLVHLIQGGRFNLQFGRATLAKLLQAPERADWKACARSDDEEKEECKAFKKAFAQFDPLQ